MKLVRKILGPSNRSLCKTISRLERACHMNQGTITLQQGMLEQKRAEIVTLQIELRRIRDHG